MATGDIKNNLANLTLALREIDYGGKVDVASAKSGYPEVFLPIIHYALLRYSAPVARLLSSLGYELYGKSDLRFIEGCYKILRDEFDFMPKLNKDQFFSTRFAEQKIILTCEIINLVQRKHRQLVSSQQRQGSAKKRHPKLSPRQYHIPGSPNNEGNNKSTTNSAKSNTEDTPLPWESWLQEKQANSPANSPVSSPTRPTKAQKERLSRIVAADISVIEPVHNRARGNPPRSHRNQSLLNRSSLSLSGDDADDDDHYREERTTNPGEDNSSLSVEEETIYGPALGNSRISTAENKTSSTQLHRLSNKDGATSHMDGLSQRLAKLVNKIGDLELRQHELRSSAAKRAPITIEQPPRKTYSPTQYSPQRRKEEPAYRETQGLQGCSPTRQKNPTRSSNGRSMDHSQQSLNQSWKSNDISTVIDTSAISDHTHSALESLAASVSQLTKLVQGIHERMDSIEQGMSGMRRDYDARLVLVENKAMFWKPQVDNSQASKRITGELGNDESNADFF